MSTEIADAYIALYVTMPGVKRDIEKQLDASGAGADAGRKSGEGFSGAFTGAVAGIAASVMSRAMDTVAASMDAAIARVDTMNAFPRIMQNFGYSADDATASINKISEGLQGLPTSVNSMAGMVQQLAPLTGSLDEATTLSLAFNNALLAGGKSTELQANAMEQYTQMLAVGKVDMAAWRSMVSAMPGQMNQLAQSLLGASAGQNDLYEALQSGALSFDDFNAAVMDLNENGTGAFASFQDQAIAATDGIATSQANLQTAITRGLANLVQKFKPAIDWMLTTGTQAVNEIFKALSGLVDWAAENSEWLTPVAVGLGAAAAALGIWVGVTKVAAIAQGAWNAVMAANPIMLVVMAVAALVAGLVWFFTQTELGKEIWAGFVGFLGDAWAWLWEYAIKPVVDWIVGAVNWLGAAFTWLYENAIKPAFEGVAAVFDWIYNWIIKPIIFGVVLYVSIWAAIFTWLYENVVKPVFEGIAAVFTWIYENVIQYVVAGVVMYFRIWGAIFTWLYENVVLPTFAAIGGVFDWLYQNVIVPVIDGIVGYFNFWASIVIWIYENVVKVAFEAIGATFVWLHDNVVKPIFEAIGGVFTWLYESVVMPVWAGIQMAIDAVATWILGTLWPGLQRTLDFIGAGFTLLKDTVTKVWEDIKKAAVAPVNFVIETVWNDGIKSTFDQIAEAVGLDMDLPMGTPIAFASGGVLPGFTPGRDVHDFYSPTGGRLALSGGEAIMRPEFTRFFGRDGIAMLNALSRTGGLDQIFGAGRGFAEGGVWDAIGAGFAGAKDWLAGTVGALGQIIADPLGAIEKLILEPVKALLDTLGGGGFGDMVAELPLKAIEGVKTWFSSMLAPTTGGVNGNWIGGNTLNRLLPYIAQSGTFITDTYRDPAYNAAVGGSPTSFHMDAANPAVDVAGSDAAMWAFYRLVMADPGGWRQVLWQVAGHYDHVHVANQGGVFGSLPTRKYDAGGYLEPGLTLVENRTGKPEPVFTAEQWSLIERNAGGPRELVVVDQDGVLIGRMRVEAADVVSQAFEEVS